MALSTKLIPKDDKLGVNFGMVQLVSGKTTNTSPLMIFAHGIGERGAGTTASLTTLLNGIPQQIKDGVEKYGWKCLAVQSDSAFTLNEIGFARTWGLANLAVNPKKKYGFGLSWGAGGWMGYVLASLANAKLFDAVAVDSMTWVSGNEANVVNANLPLWLGHNINDNNSGTPPAATEAWVDAINKLNPKVKAVKTMFNGPVVHGSWGSFFAIDKIPIPAGSRGLIDPAVNVWEWAEMNDADTRVQVPSLSNNPIPVPTLTAAFTAALNGNTLVLDGSGSTGYKKDYDAFVWGVDPLWGPGQGDYGMVVVGGAYGGPGKTVTNLKPGKYTVSLTVQDANGKKMQKAITLEVPTTGMPPVKVPIGYNGTMLIFSDSTQETATMSWDGKVFRATTASGVAYTL